MNDPSGRITRVEAPMASPGCCGICGVSSHDEGFAEAGLDFEFYGTFILCATCVGDYARLFGFLSPKQSDQLTVTVERQAVELVMLRKAVLGLESAVDALQSVRDLGNVLADTSLSISGVDVAIEPGIIDDGVEDSSDSGEGEQLTIDEPPSEQGPHDVRDFASADLDELLR